MTILELEEDGVRIALTIVDTPGFGDNIDNEFAYVVFELHCDSPFSHCRIVSRKLLATLNVNTTIFLQKNPVSSVILASGTTEFMHFCTLSPLLAMRTCHFPPSYYLFKINPRSLREMDIELMRRLSPRVNVIPVIGKADSLTPSELKGFKKRASAMAKKCSHIY
jgi:cell division control protein 11